MYHITKINLVIVHVYVQSTIVSPHKELGKLTDILVITLNLRKSYC